MDWDDIPKDFQNIILLVVVLIVLFALNFFINVGQFLSKNPIYLWLIMGIVGIVGVLKFLVPLNVFGVNDRDEEKLDIEIINNKATVKLEGVIDDEIKSLVNLIVEKINEWKNVAPKIRGRGKEKQLTLNMTGYLASSYQEIVLQQKLGTNRIDAVIGKIGIEAKYRPDQNEINRLFGQVDDYLRYLNHIIVVFFDTNQSMINNFRRKLKNGNYSNQVTIITT